MKKEKEKTIKRKIRTEVVTLGWRPDCSTMRPVQRSGGTVLQDDAGRQVREYQGGRTLTSSSIGQYKPKYSHSHA